jgi:elongation factor 2
VESCQPPKEEVGDWCVAIEDGTVAFTSGYQGWGFNADTLAAVNFRVNGVSRETTLRRLKRDPCRCVCDLGLKPMLAMARSVEVGGATELERVQRRLAAVGARGIVAEEWASEDRKLLLRRVAQRFMPVADALQALAQFHLPSPVDAQPYRCSVLYTGDADDGVAAAIRGCAVGGPTVMFVSKLVPQPKSRNFLAYGRVFCGRVTSGQKLSVIADGGADVRSVTVSRVVQWMGTGIRDVHSARAGAVVAVLGADKFVRKTATLTTEPGAGVIRGLKLAVSSIVRMALVPKKAGMVPRLAETLRSLVRSSGSLEYSVDEATGEHVVSGCGELQLEVLVNDLARTGLEVSCSRPCVSYCEAIAAASTGPFDGGAWLGKSVNKHNRVYMAARPLCDAALELMAAGASAGVADAGAGAGGAGAGAAAVGTGRVDTARVAALMGVDVRRVWAPG